MSGALLAAVLCVTSWLQQAVAVTVNKQTAVLTLKIQRLDTCMIATCA
jgi:hypothetical protein